MDSAFNPFAHRKPAPGADRTSREVVCAISDREQRLFLSPAAGILDRLSTPVTWVLTNDDAATMARLRETNPEVLVTCWSTPPLPEAWILSPHCALRYVCHLAGSVRRLVPRCFLERGGLVTNWGGLPSGAVAEHALLLALAALRNLSGWQQVFQETNGPDGHIERLSTRTLFGRRVGIHGFGQVARSLAALLQPFGVSIRAYSAGVPASLMQEHGVAAADSLTALATGADVFFECEALTPATAGSVSARILAALPDDAVFVNIARGRLVDETALLHAAVSGRIRVALDVVTQEPLVSESAFCRVVDAVLSPHIAGPTLDQYPECGRLAARNLSSYLAGESLAARVSLETYDRST